MSDLKLRFVVFTNEGGNKIGVNPAHVRLVEPLAPGAKIYFSGPGANSEGLSRRVMEPFDEVMRSLRDEARPRIPRE